MSKTSGNSRPPFIPPVDEGALNDVSSRGPRDAHAHVPEPCRRCKRPGAVATDWARVGGYYAGKVCAECRHEIDREQE
jgi:hypothetical protein